MSEKRSYSEFVARLKQAMVAAGYGTTRSPSGVAVDKLCEITHSTRQNCRRFLRGEALPDYEKIINIAQALNVAPGWLLFGERGALMREDEQTIRIRKEVLLKVFEHASHLLEDCRDQQGVAEFLAGLVQEISLIEANDTTYEQIIRLAVSSYLKANQRGELA